MDLFEAEVDGYSNVQKLYERLAQHNQNDGWFADYALSRLESIGDEIIGLNNFVLSFYGGFSAVTHLDVGAAPFCLSEILNEYTKIKSISLDKEPARFDLSGLKTNIIRGDIEEDPILFKNNLSNADNFFLSDASRCENEVELIPDSFSLITMWEVFEHMRINLPNSISNCNQLLEKGGILNISTPNLLSALGYFNILRHRKAYSCANNLYDEWNKINKIGHMGHVREYTAAELIAFVERFGFKLVDLKYVGRFVGKNSLPLEASRCLFKSLSPSLNVYFEKVEDVD